jgi:cystathionine beta-lyase/cystathionine gamma-synthase
MKKHTYGQSYAFATRAIHTGNDVDRESGAIKRPITMANSYALPYDPTDMNWSSAEGNLYTRNGGTNQKYLQERIASLEGGEDCVSFVAYPGLAGSQGHEVAKKQMPGGFGGVLSFGLKADHDTHNQFVSHLNVITSAVSLGHDESLIVFLGENDERQYLYPEQFSNGFFRFSVGLEDVDDIIEDIRQALKKVGLL